MPVCASTPPGHAGSARGGDPCSRRSDRSLRRWRPRETPRAAADRGRTPRSGARRWRRLDRAALGGMSRVERVAEGVAEQVEAEYRGADCDTGRDRRPWGVTQLIEIPAVGDHGPPAWRRGLDAEAEERERRLGHDRRGDTERGRDED